MISQWTNKKGDDPMSNLLDTRTFWLFLSLCVYDFNRVSRATSPGMLIGMGTGCIRKICFLLLGFWEGGWLWKWNEFFGSLLKNLGSNWAVFIGYKLLVTSLKCVWFALSGCNHFVFFQLMLQLNWMTMKYVRASDKSLLINEPSSRSLVRCLLSNCLFWQYYCKTL